MADTLRIELLGLPRRSEADPGADFLVETVGQCIPLAREDYDQD